jgi:hypothetical protein
MAIAPNILKAEATLRALGTTVSVSLQPSAVGGELWTISVSPGERDSALGQGSDLAGAIANIALVNPPSIFSVEAVEAAAARAA